MGIGRNYAVLLSLCSEKFKSSYSVFKEQLSVAALKVIV